MKDLRKGKLFQGEANPNITDRCGFGGASRFFYTAKASSSERHYAGRNGHPTVKPVDLMRWLCRLVTPPGGLILDPFMGSGSTGVAAFGEGFRFLGMDISAEYCDIARRRIAGPLFAQEPA
jgi:site-specific DNA-methyltransferase (adenine-specific)